MPKLSISSLALSELQTLNLQVQKWAPTADKKANVQVLIGFGAAYVDIQWNGPQSEAEAAIQSSGILSVPELKVRQLTSHSFFLKTYLKFVRSNKKASRMEPLYQRYTIVVKTCLLNWHMPYAPPVDA